MLMDIGTEELSHLEVVGCLARLHLKPSKFDREAAEADPLIAGGGGINLFNSQGNPWTADYLKITGELDVDLRSNIAAEARAKIVYERLINFTDDAGTKDALQFLMSREIAHVKAFSAALISMEKPPFTIGPIAATPGLINQYVNNSTGIGDEGEIDTRGPWNEGDSWEYVPSPALRNAAAEDSSAALVVESTPSQGSEDFPSLLIDELRDLLHAEKQLVKALPDMAEAARHDKLRELFEVHLTETEAQVERLNECFDLLGQTARAKPCKGMMGLVEEGSEIIKEGERKGDAAAHLALIGAAQRVEHYEIAGYTTAKNLAQQLHHSAIVALLSKSLGEEENADQLLNQVARSLMSIARLPVQAEPV